MCEGKTWIYLYIKVFALNNKKQTTIKRIQILILFKFFFLFFYYSVKCKETAGPWQLSPSLCIHYKELSFLNVKVIKKIKDNRHSKTLKMFVWLKTLISSILWIHQQTIKNTSNLLLSWTPNVCIQNDSQNSDHGSSTFYVTQDTPLNMI